MTPLQEHIYQILIVVDRVCEKHGIPYFLFFGSAIGALRHKGFIPWDDDADICMLRPDYERFLKICATELPEGYSLQHFSVEPDFFFPIIRVLKTNVRIRLPAFENMPIRKNVYMDILSLDSLPKTVFEHRVQLFLRRWIRILMEIKNVNHVAPRWRNRMLVRFVRPFLNNYKLTRFQDRVSAWGRSNKSEYVWSADAPYSPKQVTFPRKWLERRRRVMFENHEFWISADAEACLEKTYGDYMTPPPPEKQITHGCELLCDEISDESEEEKQ